MFIFNTGDVDITKCKLSMKDICDIIETAVDKSSVEGVYIIPGFEALVVLYTAVYLYPERKEELLKGISESFFETFDNFVRSGDLERMKKDFPSDVYLIDKYGDVWLESQQRYSLSAHSLIDGLSNLTSESVMEIINKFNEVAGSSKIDNVIQLADKWGLNNGTE